MVWFASHGSHAPAPSTENQPRAHAVATPSAHSCPGGQPTHTASSVGEHRAASSHSHSEHGAHADAPAAPDHVRPSAQGWGAVALQKLPGGHGQHVAVVPRRANSPGGHMAVAFDAITVARKTDSMAGRGWWTIYRRSLALGARGPFLSV